MLIPRRRPHVLPDETQRLGAPAEKDEAAIRDWEQAIAGWSQAPHAVALNSGRQGMSLILKQLGIGPGDEVVVPAYTLGALIPLVQALGAQPVPADVDAGTFNLTPESVSAAITPRTRAIMVLHAFGAPAPVDAIAAACEVPIIEDCAHALGATLHGRPVGGFGYAGFFSFEITKPVNTYGGGMVVTRDAALDAFIREEISGYPLDPEGLLQKIKAARMERLLMSTGLAWPLLMALTHPLTRGPLSAAYRSRQVVPSGAAAYAPAQARLGLAKWKSLDARIRERASLADQYRKLLRPEIALQQVAPTASSTWYFLVAVLPVPAAQVKLRLLSRGIDTATGDEIADDAGAMLGVECPVAARLQRNAVALPLYEGLSPREVERVARALNRAF